MKFCSTYKLHWVRRT